MAQPALFEHTRYACGYGIEQYKYTLYYAVLKLSLFYCRTGLVRDRAILRMLWCWAILCGIWSSTSGVHYASFNLFDAFRLYVVAAELQNSKT